MSFPKRRSATFLLFFSALAFISALLFFSCAPPPPLQSVLQGQTMGTTYQIKYLSAASNHTAARQVELQQQVDLFLKQFNQRFSTYEATSEISQLNQRSLKAEVRQQPVSDDFFFLLQFILKFSAATKGAMDPTIGPLVEAWGFGSRRREQVAPAAEELTPLRSLVGYEKIKLFPSQKQITLPPKMQLDFSAVAKGYGVDGVARLLEAKGIERYFVEIGGEIRLRGLNQKERPWRVGVVDPQNPQRPKKVLALTEGGIATSGDYLNYFEKDGQRYSHLLDPLTGRPITHRLASVTVVSATAREADALATAFMIMGEERARAFAEQRGIAAYFISRRADTAEKSFASYATPAFEALLAAE